jgi:hypothetical protein
VSRRLVVDYFAYAARPGALARHAARHAARCRLPRRASGCLGTSRGSSHGSSSTTSPHAGWSSTSSPTPSVRVFRHVARLVTRLFVDYFTYTMRPVALTRRAACRVSHHRQLRLAQARRRLLRLRRTSRLLDTSRGSSRASSSTTSPRRLIVDYVSYAARPGASARPAAHHAGSLSTTSPTPRVRVPRHVAQLITCFVAPLVVDYFAYTACPGASARRVAHLTARHRLLRLCRASGCLGTSHGSSRGSLSTTPCAATSSCGHAGSTSATPCVATTCLVATLALLRVRCALPRRRLPVASRRPFISTSFPN